MNVFGETEQILDFKLCAIIKDYGAGHTAEDLMLIAFYVVAAAKNGCGGNCADTGQVQAFTKGQ